MAHLPFCVDPTLLIFGLFSLLFLPVGRAHVLLLSYALFGLDEYGLLTFGFFFIPSMLSTSTFPLPPLRCLQTPRQQSPRRPSALHASPIAYPAPARRFPRTSPARTVTFRSALFLAPHAALSLVRRIWTRLRWLSTRTCTPARRGLGNELNQ